MVGYAAATAGVWRLRTRSEWLDAAVGGLLFVAAHHALLSAGHQYVRSTVAAVVVALDRFGPVEINLVGYVAPMFAELTGWVVLGESIAVRTVVGFAVIAAGFALVKRRELAAEIRPFAE